MDMAIVFGKGIETKIGMRLGAGSGAGSRTGSSRLGQRFLAEGMGIDTDIVKGMDTGIGIGTN